MALAVNYAKTEVIEYHDDLNAWVLGQVARVTVNGVEAEGTSYNAKALPERRYVFGRLSSTTGYHADGSVALVIDANNHATRFDDYKRGIPQRITYADGTQTTATVNEQGWLERVTDENGYTTCYAYDAMGRLARTTYPSEAQSGACDDSSWAATASAFGPSAQAAYALPAGHWQYSQVTGFAHRVTYFDALWRPVLEHTYDARDMAGTQRFIRRAYDADGRQTFASYPGDNAALTAGVWTQYDALGRTVAVSQDSEQGLLTTRTLYLEGSVIAQVNPRGQTTWTRFQQFDTPAYDLPVGIAHPEGAYTDIDRDVFGKPTRIGRRNADGSLQANRYYVYDAYQQLCKSIEPETGATVFLYDPAGNLQYSSAGLNLPNPQACDIAPGRPAVARTYDARNRLTTLRFPDGAGDQSWTYTSDGLPWQLTTYNSGNGGTPVKNIYVYNHRRLLVGEAMEQVGWYSWSLGYGYEAHGHRKSVRYPTGLIVEEWPNALGQPTLVRDTDGQPYASGIQYYPNGTLKQFTYGNGIVHTLSQNARQLPARSTDSGGVQDLDMRYDANGNVTDIYDYANGPNYNRHMQYDGLDRLTAAGSWNFGGDGWHRYTYDALDNLTRWTLNGVKDYAQYLYTNNRLTSIRNGAGATVLGLDYDTQGNLRNRNGQNYAFDYGNRLREVTGKEYYRYDASGRRVLAWSPAGGSIFSIYGNDGVLRFEEDHRTAEQREHVYLQGALLATRKRAFNAGTVTTEYQHTDMLGSPVAVTNWAGQVIRRTHYQPFGEVITPGNYGGVGYTGHVHDAATGLVNMQARYMDPQLGRFLSIDPVTAYAHPGLNFNRYWYAGNNPYRFTDPDGRCFFCQFVPAQVEGKTNPYAPIPGANRGDAKMMMLVAAPAVIGATAGTAVTVGAPAAVMTAAESASLQTGLAVQQGMNATTTIVAAATTAAAGTVEADVARTVYLAAVSNPAEAAAFAGGFASAAAGVDGPPLADSYEAVGAGIGTVVVGVIEHVREVPNPNKNDNP